VEAAADGGIWLDNSDLEAVLISDREQGQQVGVEHGWSDARRMLFEFSKLGKVRQILTLMNARVEALGVRELLGAPTTMWVSVGASPTDPTSELAAGRRDLEASCKGEELRAPPEQG
jgi:hypothetical protein